MTRGMTKRVREIKNTDGLQDREEGMKKQGVGARQREMEKLKTARGNRAQREEKEKNRDMEQNTEMAK